MRWIFYGFHKSQDEIEAYSGIQVGEANYDVSIILVSRNKNEEEKWENSFHLVTFSEWKYLVELSKDCFCCCIES